MSCHATFKLGGETAGHRIVLNTLAVDVLCEREIECGQAWVVL